MPGNFLLARPPHVLPPLARCPAWLTAHARPQAATSRPSLTPPTAEMRNARVWRKHARGRCGVWAARNAREEAQLNGERGVPTARSLALCAGSIQTGEGAAKAVLAGHKKVDAGCSCLKGRNAPARSGDKPARAPTRRLGGTGRPSAHHLADGPAPRSPAPARTPALTKELTHPWTSPACGYATSGPWRARTPACVALTEPLHCSVDRAGRWSPPSG